MDYAEKHRFSQYIKRGKDGSFSIRSYPWMRYKSIPGHIDTWKWVIAGLAVVGILLFCYYYLGYIIPIPLIPGATINSNGTGGGGATTGSSWNGGTAPTTGDDAVILSGDTIQTDANWTVDNVTVNSGGILYIVTYDAILGTGSSSGNLNNSGTVRFGDNGDLHASSSSYPCLVDGGGTYDWDYGGNIDIYLGDLEVDISFQTGGGGVTITLNGDIDFDENVDIESGDTMTATSGITITWAGTFWYIDGTWNCSTSTFEYDGVGGYIMDTGTFYNLSTTSGSIRTSSGNMTLTVENTLFIDSGCTFRLRGPDNLVLGTGSASGTLDNDGNWQISNGCTLSASSSSYPVIIDGAGTWDWDYETPGEYTLTDLDFETNNINFTTGGDGVTINFARVNLDGNTLTLSDGDELHYTADHTDDTVAYVKTTGGSGGTVEIDTGVDLTSQDCTLNGSPVPNNTPGNTNWVDTISGTGTWTVSGGGDDHDLTASNLLTGALSLGSPTIDQIHNLSSISLIAGAIVFGSPTITQQHVFAATGIATGPPVLGTPTLSIGAHALTASNLVTGSPVIGTPTIGQNHALSSSNLVMGNPVLGTPTLSQVHVLTASDLVTGLPVLGTPTLSHNYVLSASSLVTGSPVIGTSTISQLHVLTSSGITTGAIALGTPILSTSGDDHHLLASDIVTGAIVLGTPTISQNHTLSASGLTSGAIVLGAPIINQNHVLTSSNIVTGATVLGTPILTHFGDDHNLVSSGITTGAVVIGTPIISQIHSLTSSNLVTGSLILGTPTITQLHILSATGIVTGAIVIGSPTLGEYLPAGLPAVEGNVTIITSLSGKVTIIQSLENNLTIINSVEGKVHLR